MTLFSAYSGQRAGGIISNMNPNVFVYPHIPLQKVGSNGQRLQPTERGSWFLRQGARPVPGDFSNPVPSSGSCGCGGNR